MNTKDTLRLNGYSLDSEGRIACRAGVKANPFIQDGGSVDSDAARFKQTWCAVVAIEVAHGDARAIVDKLIVAADSPRAIVGRKRDGSAVLLFKCEAQPVLDRLETFGTRDGSVRFTIKAQSGGATLDISDYSWAKERSPIEIERDRLPTLTDDVPTLVFAATGTVDCTKWAMVDYQRKSAEESEKLRARMVTGEIPTTMQKQADAEDDALVAQYEGQEVNVWNMGNAGALIQQARARVAAREAAKVDPGARDARGLRRLRAMFG